MQKYGKEADIYSLGITLYWLLNNRRMPLLRADEILNGTKSQKQWCAATMANRFRRRGMAVRD